jgi:hypothetical protein
MQALLLALPDQLSASLLLLLLLRRHPLCHLLEFQQAFRKVLEPLNPTAVLNLRQRSNPR